MLNYEIKETTLRIGKDKGQKRYQAQRMAQGRMTLAMVESEIVQKTSLARGDVRNAIASLAEVVNSALLAGNIVELGDLGSFNVQANGRMMKTPEEVTAKSIKKPQIRYNPKVAMRKYAQEVTINVHRPGDAKPKAEGVGGSESGRSDTHGGSEGHSL